MPSPEVLAFLDPVFHIPPAVIDLDYLAAREPGVGHHQTEAREQLAPVPLDLSHYPPRTAPALGLAVAINDLDSRLVCFSGVHAPARGLQSRARSLPVVPLDTPAALEPAGRHNRGTGIRGLLKVRNNNYCNNFGRWGRNSCSLVRRMERFPSLNILPRPNPLE